MGSTPASPPPSAASSRARFSPLFRPARSRRHDRAITRDAKLRRVIHFIQARFLAPAPFRRERAFRFFRTGGCPCIFGVKFLSTGKRPDVFLRGRDFDLVAPPALPIPVHGRANNTRSQTNVPSRSAWTPTLRTLSVDACTPISLADRAECSVAITRNNKLVTRQALCSRNKL